MDDRENWVWVAGKSFGIPMLRSQGAFASGVADDGELTLAIGYGAFASGRNTKAIGDYSHVEGRNTTANYAGHAEGVDTKALNQYAHAEGYKTQALSIASHAEGANTIVTGQRAHAEGTSTQAIGNNSHAEGSYTFAVGNNSHSEGGQLDTDHPTAAIGEFSHAEGQGTQAKGLATHSEGRNNIAEGNYSHVEGRDNFAYGVTSHVEGTICQTGEAATNAHAEGHGTKALGVASHSEGWGTQANSDYQHVQGRWNLVDTKNIYAHIVGNGNVDRTDPNNPVTTRSNAHTVDWDGNAWFAGEVTVGENKEVLAKKSEVPTVQDWAQAETKPTYTADEIVGIVGKKIANTGEIFNDYIRNEAAAYAHAEGYDTKAIEQYAHAEGNGSQASGKISHAEGRFTYAVGGNSHSEGNTTRALGTASHAEGYQTVSGGNNSHVEGENNIVGKFKKDEDGNFLDEDGNVTTVTTKYVYESGGLAAHAEGQRTHAEGDYSHAEGRQTLASGANSHAEGRSTIATGISAHAEGNGSDATGNYSHAEGYDTTASGNVSHAEGSVTIASGSYSHAEGYKSEARASYSHTEGRETLASGQFQHVQGKWNIEDTTGEYAHIVGNGKNADSRSNAHTIDWSGNAWFAGDVTVGPNGDRLAKISEIGSSSSEIIHLETADIDELIDNGLYYIEYVTGGTVPHDEYGDLALDVGLTVSVHNRVQTVDGCRQRRWTGTIWTPWVWIVRPPLEADVEYLTNEIYRGHRVYIKQTITKYMNQNSSARISYCDDKYSARPLELIPLYGVTNPGLESSLVLGNLNILKNYFAHAGQYIGCGDNYISFDTGSFNDIPYDLEKREYDDGEIEYDPIAISFIIKYTKESYSDEG